METENSTQVCPYCGEKIKIGAKKCRHCNEWLEEPPAGYLALKEKSSVNNEKPGRHTTQQEDDGTQPSSQTPVTSMPQNNTVTVNYEPPAHNGVGTAGFVLSLISLVLSWVPGVGWFVWFLGALLSFIGMFKRPRGLAVFGFIISFIDVIILVTVVGAGIGILSSIF